MNLLYAGLLFVGALFMGFLEIFIPSGGLVALLAAGLAAASLYFAFAEGVVAGCAFLAAALVGGAFTAAAGFRLFPHTRFGRRLLLGRPSPELNRPRFTEFDPAALQGQEGAAWTALRPAGTAVIGGQRLDVVTEGAFIEKDARVRVVRVEGNRVVVRESAPPPA